MESLKAWIQHCCVLRFPLIVAICVSALIYTCILINTLPLISQRHCIVTQSEQSAESVTNSTIALRSNLAGEKAFTLQHKVKSGSSMEETNSMIANRSNLSGEKTFSLQRKVKPGSSMEETNFPKEFIGGSPMLKERTYPKKPRVFKCNKCFKYNYDQILKPNSCDAPGAIKLLIMVTTVPSARPQRDALRQTWLSLTRNNTASVRYLFLLGSGWPAKEHSDLSEENQQFGDILQDDYIDTYYNLSIKVLSGFKYSVDICKRAQFISRSADDNFVNLPEILTLLKEDKVQHPIFGYCKMAGDPVDRRTHSKWAVTKTEWNLPRYPPYCVGTTFLLSWKTMQTLYNASENVPYYVMEDVYFGEVARQTDIKVLDLPHFILNVPRILRSGYCLLPSKWKAVHEVPPQVQFPIWKHCLKEKKIP